MEDVTLWAVKKALISAGQELSENRILEMIAGIGKIEHDGLKINFREFSLMCWRNLFQNDDEGVGEVKEAFQILGGNDDGSGVVNVERLKDFTRRSELSIDIDRFVADVDDDRSGMVDYEEFRQLFDGSLDTAQLFSDNTWLRTEAGNTKTRSSPSRTRSRPAAVSIDGVSSDARGNRSPTSARPASTSLTLPFGQTESAGSPAAVCPARHPAAPPPSSARRPIPAPHSSVAAARHRPHTGATAAPEPARTGTRVPAPVPDARRRTRRRRAAPPSGGGLRRRG
jgi:Ca2+-binding EF-hand superfamily protein